MVNDTQETQQTQNVGGVKILDNTPEIIHARLEDLEDIAMYMAKQKCQRDPKILYEQAFHEAMDEMRGKYNMHFIMLCGRCRTYHLYDRLTAPER